MDLMPYLKQWAVPGALVTGGLLVGLVAEKAVRPLMVRAARKLNLDYLELLITAMKRMPLLWGFLAGFAGALSGMPLKDSLASFLQRIPTILFLLSLIVVASRVGVGLFEIHSKRSRGDTQTLTLFSNITKLIIYVIGGLIILQSLGISITPILTALGVGGLAVALALQETLSNLFAGLHILATGQVKQGDYVRLESGQEGYVTDVTWRNTTIQTIQNNMVIVPNSSLASTILTNYNMPFQEMNVYVYVGIHYKSDLEHVERVTLDVARQVLDSVEGAAADEEPRIRYSEFGSSSINFRVIMKVKDFYAQYLVAHEFIKRLHRRYDEEDITIPFNMVTLDIPDRPEIVIRGMPGTIGE